MHLLKFIPIVILMQTQLMGQIILSQTNERFEMYVNDIVKQHVGKRLEFAFFDADSGKTLKTELIKVDWKRENVIVVAQASIDYGLSLDQIDTNTYKYVDGYFSDLTKRNGNYVEVTKADDKNLVLKGYRDGKLAIEHKITLNHKKEIIFSDHLNYYAGSATKPIRTITTYSKRILNNFTRVTTQESNDITSGVKKLNHKFETTEISSFDKKSNIETLTCTLKAVLQTSVQPDEEFRLFLTRNTSGKIIKVQYPDKKSMTIQYK